MTRFFRLLIGLPVLASGILIGLYGLLALLYRDEGGGSTYVTLFGHQMNAHFVGVSALVLALAVIFVSVWFMRRRNSRFAKPSK